MDEALEVCLREGVLGCDPGFDSGSVSSIICCNWDFPAFSKEEVDGRDALKETFPLDAPLDAIEDFNDFNFCFGVGW